MIVAASVAAAALAGVEPNILQPSGPWELDYGTTACSLGREYTEGTGTLIVAWRAVPLARSYELSLVRMTPNKQRRRGMAQVSIVGGQASGAVPYDFYGNETLTVIRTEVDIAILAKPPEDATMTISLSSDAATSVSVPGAAKAFAALAACNDAIAKQWGIDPAERLRVATDVEGDLANFLRNDDYPLSGLERGAIGSTTVLYGVDPAGKISDCRVVITSGWKQLDDAGCPALLARGRFRAPAVGIDGKPMSVHYTRKIVWSLPAGFDEDLAYEAWHTAVQQDAKGAASAGRR